MDLSHLDKQAQTDAFEIASKHKLTLTIRKASALKSLSESHNNGILSRIEIEEILIKDKHFETGSNKKILLDYSKIRQYLPSNIAEEKIEKLVIEALKAKCGK